MAKAKVIRATLKRGHEGRDVWLDVTNTVYRSFCYTQWVQATGMRVRKRQERPITLTRHVDGQGFSIRFAKEEKKK